MDDGPTPAELRRRLRHAELWMHDANKGSAPNSRSNAEVALNSYFNLVEQMLVVLPQPGAAARREADRPVHDPQPDAGGEAHPEGDW
jgi:hypothetical protein